MFKVDNHFIDNDKALELVNQIHSLFVKWQLSIEEVDLVIRILDRKVQEARQNQVINKNMSRLGLFK